jgi:peptidoglycan-N-acetylglucosamine deacetylase
MIGSSNLFKYMLKSVLESSVFPLEIIWRGKSPGKQLALTFDDGPDPNHTLKLLDALDQLNLEATFFLMGEKVLKHPGILREILNRGHEIGNHSFSHNGFRTEPIKDFVYEIEQANDVFEQTAGIRTSLLRPPFGKLSVPLLRYCVQKGMVIVMWSLDCRDSFDYSSVSVSSKVIRNARKNDIFLMHDDGILSRDIVRDEIPRLIDRGFTFTKISRMVESLRKSDKNSVDKGS